ncbi:MAG: hypothetical protein QM817_22555 [Archangium sp.]
MLWLLDENFTLIEVRIPFFSKPSATPHVVFAKYDLSDLRLIETGPQLSTPDGRVACVCPGQFVGRLPHRLELHGNKRVLCAMPPNGSIDDCVVPSVRMPSNAGDFPPYVPERFTPRRSE